MSKEDDAQYVFRDSSFPATDESLYFKSDSSKWAGIEWKRPRVGLLSAYGGRSASLKHQISTYFAGIVQSTEINNRRNR